MRIVWLLLILAIGCQHPAPLLSPMPDCQRLMAAPRLGSQMPPDSGVLERMTGFWRLSLTRPATGSIATGLATLWTGYSKDPLELIGSHGVDLKLLRLTPYDNDGSLQLWQVRGDTIGMHIGSPWQGPGVTFYAVGAGRDTIAGCWFQMGPDSSTVNGYFRLDQTSGPAT
jgi:hypothetical protein